MNDPAPDLDWIQNTVALQDGLLYIKLPGEHASFTGRTIDSWLAASEAAWKVNCLQQELDWIRDRSAPDPKLAALRDKLRTLAAEAKTTEQQQIYAHALLLLDLSLPPSFTP